MVEQAAQRTHDQGATGGQLALWLGLLAAVVALTTAMGQIERGRQPHLRHRARPSCAAEVRAGSADGADGRTAAAARIPRHYRRAMCSASRLSQRTASATRSRRCGRSAVGRLESCWPGPLSPSSSNARRAGSSRAYSWLAFGAGASLVLWLLLTGLLALYVVKSGSFGEHLRSVRPGLRPAAVGQPVLGRAVPRRRVRRAARGGSGRRTGADDG